MPDDTPHDPASTPARDAILRRLHAVGIPWPTGHPEDTLEDMGRRYEIAAKAVGEMFSEILGDAATPEYRGHPGPTPIVDPVTPAGADGSRPRPTPAEVALVRSEIERYMRANGIVGDAPADPITPAEAAEAMDDDEADDPGDMDGHVAVVGRSWAEADAREEVARRFDLDTVGLVSEVVEAHAVPTDGDHDGEPAYKLARTPIGLDDEITEFLRGVIRLGTSAVDRLRAEGGRR